MVKALYSYEEFTKRSSIGNLKQYRSRTAYYGDLRCRQTGSKNNAGIIKRYGQINFILLGRTV